jgi:hypothetical protein
MSKPISASSAAVFTGWTGLGISAEESASLEDWEEEELSGAELSVWELLQPVSSREAASMTVRIAENGFMEENSFQMNDTEPEKRKKRCSNRNISFLWCEGWDLNPHSIATASTSSWCVCHSATLARNDIYYIIPVGSCQ